MTIELLPRLRRVVDRAVRRACVALAERLPAPTVYHGRAGRYLARWRVTSLAALQERWDTLLGYEPWPAIVRHWIERDGWRLTLHFFHRSDEDLELHTHPWDWAVALQLAGGYVEERRIADSVVRTRFGPGSLVFLRAETAHRVDLLDPERGSWSLILSGPIVASWGFYERGTWGFTPWREFIARKGREGRTA